MKQLTFNLAALLFVAAGSAQVAPPSLMSVSSFDSNTVGERPRSTIADRIGTNTANLSNKLSLMMTAEGLRTLSSAVEDVRSAGVKGDGTLENAILLSTLFSTSGIFTIPNGTYNFPSSYLVPFGSRVTVDPRATVSSSSSATPLQVNSGPSGQPMPIWSDDSLTKTYNAAYQGYANVFTLFRAIVSNQTTPAVAIMGNANGGVDGTANTHVWGANFAAGSLSNGSTSIATELDFGVLSGNGSSIGLNVATNGYVDNLAGSMIRMQASNQGRTGHGILFDGSTGGPQITIDLLKTTGGMNPATGIDLSLSNFSIAEYSSPQFGVGPTPGVTFTGTLTQGSTSVTAVTNAGLLKANGYIRGTGITDNTTIKVIDIENNIVTLSTAPVASGMAVNLFSPQPQTQVRYVGGGPQTSPSLSAVGFGANAKSDDSFTVQSLGNGIMKMQTGDGNTHLTLASNASVDLGSDNAITGLNSIGLGSQHVLSGASSFSVGYGGTDRGAAGKLVSSGGFFTMRGDSQAAEQVMRGASEASTGVIQLTTTGVSPNTTNSIPLPNNSSFLVYGWVVARNTGSGDAKAWYLDGALVTRGSGASTVALVSGSDSFAVKGATSGTSSWTASLAADTKNGGIAITVGGSTNLHMTAEIRTVEVQ